MYHAWIIDWFNNNNNGQLIELSRENIFDFISCINARVVHKKNSSASIIKKNIPKVYLWISKNTLVYIIFILEKQKYCNYFIYIYCILTRKVQIYLMSLVNYYIFIADI